MMRLVRGYGFLLALAAAIALGAGLPWLGSAGTVPGSKFVGQAAIFLIFALMGLQLETSRLANDLAAWRLHLLIQATTFVLLPAVTLCVAALAGGFFPAGCVVGFLYLGILPTTISTAIVFTMRAGGNMPAAVFNCALSNIEAVFIVPVWMAWQMAGGSATSASLLPVLTEVSLCVLVPILIGQVMRPMLGTWAQRHRTCLARVANGLILLLVFRAFASSTSHGAWDQISVPDLLALVTAVLSLLALAKCWVWLAARLAGLSRPSQITAFFCGSQKSIASGVALAGPVFSGHPEVSMAAVILPVLLYHAAQLALGAWIAERFGTYER